MNKENKKEFIEIFVTSVKEKILNNIDKIPEHWNGVELRHLVYQNFRQENNMINPYCKKQYRRRLKECDNDIIINNL